MPATGENQSQLLTAVNTTLINPFFLSETVKDKTSVTLAGGVLKTPKSNAANGGIMIYSTHHFIRLKRG